MTIRYDPQKVTDWLTPLEKVYSRQSQQLDRYHQQLIERDRQEEEARIDLPEVFGKLAQFSKTIGSVVEARTAHQQRKTDFDWKQFKEPDKIRLEKLIKEGSVIDDHNEFVKLIANDKLLSRSAKLSLQSKSGAYFHRLRKTIGFQKVNNSYYYLNREINKQGSKHALEYAKVKHDPMQAEEYIDRFIGNELKELGFDDAAIFNYFGSAISTRSKSKALLDSIKEEKIRLAEKTQLLGNDINIQNELIHTDPNGVARLLQTTIFENTNKALGIDRTQAKHNVSVQIERLIDTGEVQLESIIANNYGLVEHPSGDIIVKEENQEQYPGFKVGARLGKGELLFSIEDQNKWTAASNRYKKRIVDQNKANVITQGINIEATIGLGEKSIEELTILKGGGLELIERVLGKEHPSYKSLTNLDVTLQKPESYAAIKAEYQEFFTGSKKGQRIQNEAKIKEIPNVKVRNELLDLIKEDKAIRSSIGYPATFKENNTSTGEKIINANKTLNEESHLTGPVQHMQIEITQKRDWFLADAMDKIPNDPQAAFIKADGDWEQWLTKEGFYVTADKEGSGRFSPETNGEYKNYKNSIKARNLNIPNWDLVEAREFTNKNKMTKWDNIIFNAAQNPSPNGKTFTEKLISTPLLEEDDIIAPIQFGWKRSVDGNQFKITSKTGYIASRIPNVTRVEFWKAQATLLINSDNPKHKELVKTYQLEKAVKEIEDPQRTLIDFAENTGDKYLKYVIQQNPEQVSPKQWDRLIKKSEDTSTPTPTPTAENRLNFKERFPQFMDLSEEELNQKIIELLPKIQEILN